MQFRFARQLWLESTLGRRLGARSWDYFWLAGYLIAVTVFVSPHMLAANLVAAALSVALCGPGFAAGVAIWALGLVVWLRFPWALGVAVILIWLGLAASAVHRHRTSARDSASVTDHYL